jgi:hypothetical protein
MSEEKKCLKCSGVSVKRGLCARCYKGMKKAVDNGQFTWEKLVELGHVLPKESEKCIQCENSASARGLCQSCYINMRGQVSIGITTWKELEDDGLAKPLKQKNRESGGKSKVKIALEKLAAYRATLEKMLDKPAPNAADAEAAIQDHRSGRSQTCDEIIKEIDDDFTEKLELQVVRKDAAEIIKKLAGPPQPAYPGAPFVPVGAGKVTEAGVEVVEQEDVPQVTNWSKPPWMK